MKTEETRVRLEALSPMLKLCTLFASFPPYSFNKNFKTTGRRYKIYTIAFLVFIMCISTYQTYGKLTCKLYNVNGLVVKLPDDSSNIFLLVFTIRTAILNYTKCDELKLFLHKLERFDKAISRNSTRGKLFRNVFIVLNFASMVVVVSHGVVFGISSGIQVCKYDFAKCFMYYLLCTNLIMVVWIGVEIKFRYHTLNDFLLKYNYHLHDTNRSPQVLNKVSVHLKSVRMWHNDLCNLVERYNNLFGISMLLFVLFDVSNVLNNAVTILDMVIQGHSTTDGLKGYKIFVSLVCLVSSLVRTLMLALSSKDIAKAAGRMTIICYKLLNEVPVVPENDYDIMLNEKLHLIARQGFFRKPHVSGAGFFEVNLEIMGSVATWVTVYIIVFLEFHIKRGN